MKSDINDLCEAFLAALTNAGYAVKSIENYKQVSNRFKKFCAENGYDTYTVNIGQIFADNVFNEETGAFVGYRNVMYGRFVRLINSFYLQGTFDFSMVTKEKNLPKSIHLIEIYQDYMEHLKTQYSNIGTIGFFQNGMLHLLRYMEDGGILTLKDLAVSDVVNYICSWSQKHQRNVLCILRNIFQHFGREDLYFAVAGIHPYRTKRIVPMFTDNEIMSIEEVLSSPSVSHRDAAIFFLGLTTGMRAVDVVDLRLANIDWDNETIFFQQSKTGNAVCLPLTVDIGNSIYRYILEERPRVDDDHVFLRSQAPFIPLGGHSTCYYIVSNILQRAGIQKDGRIWGMCMLRHNAASMMVQNSIPLTTIAAILGHAETRTTDIYITADIQSKGHRDRRLFLSDELISYLIEYDCAIRNCFPKREYFFPGPSGNIISASSIPFNFRKIWLAAGLKRDGEIKPRPYDFRHHFACANIARWAKEKKDVISMLPYLMRYMGHSSLEKTYYYVHLIPDYFADYAAATENLESLLPEVEPYEI